MLLWMFACVSPETPSQDVGKFGLVFEHQFVDDGDGSDQQYGSTMWAEKAGGTVSSAQHNRTDNVRLTGDDS